MDWRKLAIAILVVIGNLASCSLTAYAFARLQFRWRQPLFALMLGTLMLPYHVTLVPQYILFLELDWVNTFLPLVVPKFLAVDAFFVFLMVQFFRGIPREIDETANRRLSQMMPELMKSAGVTESLKAEDPMKWTGLMNSLKAQAEEIILKELVFN